VRPFTGEVPGPTEGKVPLMSDPYIQHRSSGSEPHCEFERTLEGKYCPQKGEVRLGGLTLCNRHADLLRLEEWTTYWRAMMLAHLELWSGEAREAEGGPGGPARDRVDEGLGGARARFRRTGEARTRTSRGRQ
jgi:hypothetical protein